MALSLYERGVNGDATCARLWLEYTAGKPIERAEVTQTTVNLPAAMQELMANPSVREALVTAAEEGASGNPAVCITERSGT